MTGYSCDLPDDCFDAGEVKPARPQKKKQAAANGVAKKRSLADVRRPTYCPHRPLPLLANYPLFFRSVAYGHTDLSRTHCPNLKRSASRPQPQPPEALSRRILVSSPFSPT
jgi:hypothetical protein